MEVKFVDTGYISKLKIRDEAVKTNVLNSLNYASTQKILHLTSPKQLNVKHSQCI